ncbi:MAG TPA: hypothetical protein VIL66_10705 [Bacillota bacterium]
MSILGKSEELILPTVEDGKSLNRVNNRLYQTDVRVKIRLLSIV